MRKSFIVILVITAVLRFNISASSAFRYGCSEGEGLFPFSVPACDPRFSDPSSVPAYLPLLSGAFFRGSYSRPYMIEGLHSCQATAGLSNRLLGGGILWNRFGINEYMEDRLFLYSGLRITDWLYTGIRAHADRFAISVGDFSSTHTVYDGDAMILLRPFPSLSIACRQDNIHSLIRKNRRDILFPDTSFGAVFSPEPGISCGWNYFHNADGGINAWHVRATILPSFSVSTGYARETSTYAASAIILIKNISVTYGFDYHAYLGVTHRIGVVFNTDTVPFESIVMHRNESKEVIHIDITTCTSSDLMRIPSLTEEHAERIIKYRDKISPVTEKALYQLGLSKTEVNDVLINCEGIIEEETPEAKDEHHQFTPKKKRPYTAKTAQTKSLFIRFVEGGIPPSSALKITDAVVGKSGKDAANIIDSMDDVTAADKTKAKTICGK